MANLKPDLGNYLARISAIQEDLVSGSISSIYPNIGSAEPPFWLTIILAPRIRPNTDAQTDMLTLSAQMLLIRSAATNLFQPDMEAKIGADMVDVMWGFMTDSNYKRFIVGVYTTIQPGFVPESVRITPSRWEGTLGDNVGQIIGSSYIIEWQHRMRRPVGA